MIPSQAMSPPPSPWLTTEHQKNLQPRQQQHRHHHQHRMDDGVNGQREPGNVASMEPLSENAATSTINMQQTFDGIVAHGKPNTNHPNEKADGKSLAIIFGIRLDRFSATVQYLILATCLFVVYLTSGLAQEALFTSFPGFHFGFFLTFIHYSLNAYFASGQLYREQKNTLPTSVATTKNDHRRFLGVRLPWWLAVESRAPMHIFVLTAVVGVMGFSLGNEALQYLNFPTKTLMKSSKLLFIMAFGRVVLGKNYSRWDYFASLQLIAGLIMLYLANVTVSISLHPYGLGLMTASLMCDAATGNLNEKILQSYGSSATEMIFFVNMFGSLIALGISILTSQFFAAIAFCYRNPVVILYIAATSCLSFVGSNFVHNMTRQFGIVIMSTTATFRKCCSILLSFIIFPKPFVFGHFVAVILVFSGVLSRVFVQNKDKIWRSAMVVWANVKTRTRYHS